jgi:raffinose/stachyose/melibiose transport system permease protein
VQLAMVSWDGFSPVRQFVGLDNFARIFADPVFWGSLLRNVVWIAAMFASVGIGLVFALLLWMRPRGWVLFRTAYLVPEMMGTAIVGVIWLRLWQPLTGGMTGVGEALNVPFLSPSPLADSATAIWVLVGVQIWIAIGFFTVVSLAGLQSVDTTLLDAAAVDGANRRQRAWYVVIPQLRAHLSMMALLATIAGLKAFEIVWVMTQGGPGNATQLVGTYAYTKAFVQQDFGYGAALACVTVVLALGLTALTGRRRAHD